MLNARPIVARTISRGPLPSLLKAPALFCGTLRHLFSCKTVFQVTLAPKRRQRTGEASDATQHRFEPIHVQVGQNRHP